MRKNIKRFLTTALCAAAFAAVGFGVSAVSTTEVAKADEASQLTIAAKTLNVSNNVNLTFMVPATAGAKSDIKVVAREVNAVDGSEEEEVTLSAAEEDYVYGDVTYYQYIYRGVSATEMPNVVYAYAYTKSNPENVSAEKKFSIIEYAHKQLGLVAGYEKNADLEELLLATLNYGEAAAKYAGNTSLPSDYVNGYTYVKLTNAIFEDKFDYAFLPEESTVVITPIEGWDLKSGVEGFVKNDDGSYTYTVPTETPDLSGAFEDVSARIPAANKLDYEQKAFDYEATNTVMLGGTVELPTAVHTYEDVTITWFDHNGEAIDAATYTFEADGEYVFTVQFECEGETVETDITFSVVASDAQKVAHELAAFTYEAINSLDMKDSCILPTATEKYNDVTITWKNGAEVLGESYTFAEDKQYTFTVEFTCGDVTDSKTIIFNVTATAKQKVDHEKTAFVFENTNVKAETTIALPTATAKYGDVTISWWNGEEEITEITFAEAGNYTLTVEFSIDETVENTEIHFVVEASDRQKVEAAAAALSFTLTEAMVGDKATLPTASGVTVTWEATGASVSGNTVTFDVKGTATLTATITCGEAKQTKEFTVTVTGPLATFEFGANRTEQTHSDSSSSKSTYTETNSGYTLSITNASAFYPGSYDAKGNSCIKLGTGSNTSSFTFTVPAEVGKVIINIAGYKANKASITVNGVTTAINTISNNGEYTALEIDTSINKTVTLVTNTSPDKRAMLNSIVFYQGEPLSDEKKVETELEALNSFTLPAEVTSATEIALRTAGATYNDVTIAWSVNDEAAEFVSIVDGKLIINLPAEDATVFVTATLICGEAEDTKEYEIYVDVLDASEKVAEVKAALAGSTEVEGDAEVALPENPRNDVNVSWALSDTTWASLNGNKVSITNPDEDITITVTATITCGTASDTATYTIQVKFVDTSAPVEPVTAEIVFSKLYSDTTNLDGETHFIDAVASVVFNGNAGSTKPQYYVKGNGVRVYGKNSMKVSVEDGYKITSIVVTTDSSNTITTSNCTITGGTMSISGQTVTVTITQDNDIVFTNPATSGHFRVQKITVTYQAI